jgi:hypothetical protein
MSEDHLKSEDNRIPLNRVFRLFVPAEPLTAIWRTLWRTLWRTKMIFSHLGTKKAALESRRKTCQ